MVLVRLWANRLNGKSRFGILAPLPRAKTRDRRTKTDLLFSNSDRCSRCQVERLQTRIRKGLCKLRNNIGFMLEYIAGVPHKKQNFTSGLIDRVVIVFLIIIIGQYDGKRTLNVFRKNLHEFILLWCVRITNVIRIVDSMSLTTIPWSKMAKINNTF